MNRLFMTLGVTVLGVTLSMTSHADRMVVLKGNAVLLAADDFLSVFPDSPNSVLSCSFNPAAGAFVPGASAGGIQIPLPGATDVKVIGTHAYVARSNFENSAAVTGYVKYDISACMPAGPFTPFRAHANLGSGELVIPCIEVDGSEYNVVMNQRGNSMNWEVQFVNTGCY